MNLKAKLADRDYILNGHVAVIPSAVAAQAMAAAGADFLVFDREHGPESLHAMIAATQGTGCAPLVRIPAIEETEVKRALGGVAFDAAQAQALRAKGYRMLTGFDLLWLKAAIAECTRWARS